MAILTLFDLPLILPDKKWLRGQNLSHPTLRASGYFPAHLPDIISPSYGAATFRVNGTGFENCHQVRLRTSPHMRRSGSRILGMV